MPTGYGSLDIDEDMAFQRRSWAVERVGWTVMALLIVAALLGLFSDGPLSRTTAESADGAVRVQYERFLRAGGPAPFRIEAAAPGGGAEVSLRLDGSIVDALEIEQIQPPPARAAADPGGITYVFSGASPGEPVLVHIWAVADRVGGHAGNVTALGRPPATLSFFVYP